MGTATIIKNWDRWLNTTPKMDFVTYLGNVYWPVKRELEMFRGMGKTYSNIATGMNTCKVAIAPIVVK